MKYLVVSDSHGDRDILVKILEEYQNKVDLLFHCGDSELPHQDELFQSFISVRGNCDYDVDFPRQIIEKTALDTIFMTHGHLFNVRMGMNSLVLEAEENHADLAFFGHTHELGCQKFGSVLVLNPGSISQPRGPIRIPTFAIVTSEEKHFMVDYYNRHFEKQEKLARKFEK